jgi:hypothetical protein
MRLATLNLAVRFFGLIFGLLIIATPVLSRAGDALALTKVLRLDEVIDVMRDEGQTFGTSLDDDMLDGRGGAFWARQVAQLYDPERMKDTVRMALANRMNDTETAMAIAFFQAPPGQRILTLETSARQAMADPDVEQIARTNYEDLKDTDDPRLIAVSQFVKVNDLLERNVAGTLSASFDFMRGLVDGGAGKMSENQIVAEVWAQEAETRIDTEVWLYGFLLMAYQPLSDAELEAYVDFSATSAGQALNTALFDGFDTMYRWISYELGVLVAGATTSSDL